MGDSRANERAVCKATHTTCAKVAPVDSARCAMRATHAPTVIGWPTAERVAFGPDRHCERDPRTGAWSYVDLPARHRLAPLDTTWVGYVVIGFVIAYIVIRRIR